MVDDIRYQSLFIRVNESDTLHLKRIYREPTGTPILLIHGSIENGRIFYTDKGNGLAPFLARHGFDVYVGDLRGRGLGTPKVSRQSKFGQSEAISEDIPAFVAEIRKLRGTCKMHWMAHSWGGVLLFSTLARFPEYRQSLHSIICFASRRTISLNNARKWLMVDVLWSFVAKILCLLYGYVPAKEWRLGSDNETAKFYREVSAWIGSNSPWLGFEDGFEYRQALHAIDIPPLLHLTGAGDNVITHETDVRAFLAETGAKHVSAERLSHANGHKHDYGHIDILTHPDAVTDHFPRVVDWLRQFDHS